jgi:hypothetical protein
MNAREARRRNLIASGAPRPINVGSVITLTEQVGSLPVDTRGLVKDFNDDRSHAWVTLLDGRDKILPVSAMRAV